MTSENSAEHQPNLWFPTDMTQEFQMEVESDANCAKKNIPIKKSDLIEYLFNQGLTPNSDACEETCEGWLRNAFPEATNFQISKVCKDFLSKIRKAWKKCRWNRQYFLDKTKKSFCNGFNLPIDDSTSKINLHGKGWNMFNFKL